MDHLSQSIHTHADSSVVVHRALACSFAHSLTHVCGPSPLPLTPPLLRHPPASDRRRGRRPRPRRRRRTRTRSPRSTSSSPRVGSEPARPSQGEETGRRNGTRARASEQTPRGWIVGRRNDAACGASRRASSCVWGGSPAVPREVLPIAVARELCASLRARCSARPGARINSPPFVAMM